MDSALLITLVGGGPDRCDLSRHVGGVPLIQRQVRVLRAVGISRITILCAEEDCDPLGQLDTGDLQLLPVTDADSSVAAMVDTIANASSPVLVLVAAWVFEQAAVQRLIDDVGQDELRVATTRSAGEALPTGLFVVGPSAAGRAGDWIEAWAQVDAAAALPLEAKAHPIDEGGVVGAVNDEASRRRIEDLLWERCRKPTDGFVARYFNRHVSLFISRRLAASPIKPNHISILNILLGVASMVLAAQGSYGHILLGAILLKTNSVLDGVDGELARIRVEASVTGEWLDTIGDDLSNLGFFSGLSWGSYAATGQTWWLALGAAAVLPMLGTCIYYYRWCYAHGRGDILAFDWFHQAGADNNEPPGRLRAVTSFFSTLFRRDSFVTLLLAAAVLDWARFTLFIFAPVGVAVFVALMARHRSLVRRAST